MADAAMPADSAMAAATTTPDLKIAFIEFLPFLRVPARPAPDDDFFAACPLSSPA
jgi:hypothetical protein